MYIDTHTNESIFESLCRLMPYSLDEAKNRMANHVTSATEYDTNAIVHIPFEDNFNSLPDEVLLYHLSRRLMGTEDDVIGYNLASLLTSNNIFSEFLKKHGIEFNQSANHLETIYNGRIINWSECIDGNKDYIMGRLGYHKKHIDYCFNGFGFREKLENNIYYNNLSYLPEFLSQLIECLNCSDIEEDYMKCSRYYCYEYKAPIDEIIIDGYEGLTYLQKQRFVIGSSINRLINRNNPYNDDDNIIFRFPDNFIVPKSYYISKQLLK